jgi:hypothetical protein
MNTFVGLRYSGSVDDIYFDGTFWYNAASVVTVVAIMLINMCTEF